MNTIKHAQETLITFKGGPKTMIIPIQERIETPPKELKTMQIKKLYQYGDVLIAMHRGLVTGKMWMLSEYSTGIGLGAHFIRGTIKECEDVFMENMNKLNWNSAKEIMGKVKVYNTEIQPVKYPV